MFVIEYAGWFRVSLNGRYRLGMYTPLGGTGNYLLKRVVREVGLWNSLNLAEDAEIAIRLTLQGKKICVIDTKHWEEAPVELRHG